MPLVNPSRCSGQDIDYWKEMAELDQAYACGHSRRLERLEVQAISDIREFFAVAGGYAGLSWGKDSVVMAHLLWLSGLKIPMVSVRSMPLVPPECDDVRDAFLASHQGCDYSEIDVWCTADPADADGWHQSGTLERGFAIASERYGDRYASGIRGAEAAGRERRMCTYGTATRRTLAPIGWWKTEDVFAYMQSRQLPVHPAYAMTMGGSLDRSRLRVSFLTLKSGEGRGRREWEQHYYRGRLYELKLLADEACNV